MDRNKSPFDLRFPNAHLVEPPGASPSWVKLIGEVVHLCISGDVIGFQRNPEGERELEPRVMRRSKLYGKLLAVEQAGIWIGPPDESTWNFISFSSITSACLMRPADG